MKNMSKNLIKKGAKKAAKLAGKKLLSLLAPYIGVAALFVIIFAILALLILSIYGSMTAQGALTGIEISEEDKQIRQDYIRLCNQYNVKDTWLVSDEEPEVNKNGQNESSPQHSFYPGTGVERLSKMVDRYRNDYRLRLQFPLVHAVSLYRAYTKGEEEIPPEIREKMTDDMHPYYYYKKSLEIVSGKDGPEKTVVYLLVEAYTISGHYQYHYEWVTEIMGEGDDAYSITYERLKDTRQIFTDRWQRLLDHITKTYELSDTDDMELNKMAILEAAEGFNKQKEQLEWLINNIGISGFASSAMIPPELMPFFKEAEEEYGIPWWFLAAIAFRESSFDPYAYNHEYDTYGLMQQTPASWAAHAAALEFDVVHDKDNPRAQILAGARQLYELGLKKDINWDTEDWKEQSIGVLAFYGGYGEDIEDCRKNYAVIIWGYADKFKNVSAQWPVPGFNRISSPYGDRFHPIEKKIKFHNGIDIPAPQGTPVISISAGIVRVISYEADGYGTYIRINDGMHEYVYAHLHKTLVRVGDTVQPGQQIGEVGDTGSSTGPHLHLTIVDLKNSCTIDPKIFFGIE